MRFLLLKLVHKEGKKKYSPEISSKEAGGASDEVPTPKTGT